ncbi:hypothetical protein CHLRE_05g242502v5 [Chlamydomonas reinhardtii]|nr:uncharacterized protein CHLRE_05g242502v5 [Chlamydomonas reinhardtii]PNW83465.1 hypothetical protein CHLRE_05g242502v5 [Chlamydomonas reinhardtii]
MWAAVLDETGPQPPIQHAACAPTAQSRLPVASSRPQTVVLTTQPIALHGVDTTRPTGDW